MIKKNGLADIVVFGDDMKTDFKKSLFQVKMVMKDGGIQLINKRVLSGETLSFSK